MEAGGSTLMGRGVQQAAPTEVPLTHQPNTQRASITLHRAQQALYVRKHWESLKSAFSLTSIQWVVEMKERERHGGKERTSSVHLKGWDQLHVWMLFLQTLKIFSETDSCENRAVAEPSHPAPICRASELVPLLQTCKDTWRPALMPWCTSRDTSCAFPLPFLPLLTPGYNLLTYVPNVSIIESSIL